MSFVCFVLFYRKNDRILRFHLLLLMDDGYGTARAGFNRNYEDEIQQAYLSKSAGFISGPISVVSSVVF